MIWYCIDVQDGPEQAHVSKALEAEAVRLQVRVGWVVEATGVKRSFQVCALSIIIPAGSIKQEPSIIAFAAPAIASALYICLSLEVPAVAKASYCRRVGSPDSSTAMGNYLCNMSNMLCCSVHCRTPQEASSQYEEVQRELVEQVRHTSQDTKKISNL
jgi:hypothetical protein